MGAGNRRESQKGSQIVIQWDESDPVLKPASPQRDAAGGIAVRGSVIILRLVCKAGCSIFHSTVLRGSQKDVRYVKVT